MKKFFKFLTTTIIIFITLLGLLCVDVFFIEPNVLLTKSQKLEIPNWNKDLNGFKIALVTDIHLGTRFVDLKKLDKIVKTINAKNPDLIVIGGDLDAKSISKEKYSTTQIANILKNLKSKHGVIAVMGNHDYVPPSVVKNIYQKSNIILLENEDYYFSHNAKTLRIVGFKDLWYFKSNPIQVVGMKDKTTPTVVLTHNPDYFPQMPNFVSLTLSGHTHGGEIVLPFIGSFFIPSEYGQRYRNGYIIENNKHLFVSRGVATLSGGRFLDPPEINILTLYSQKEIPQNTKVINGIKSNYAPKTIRILKKHL